MITREHKTYNQLIISMLDKLSNINFLQLARYGKHKEQRYRQQFGKQFNGLNDSQARSENKLYFQLKNVNVFLLFLNGLSMSKQ